MRRRLELLSGEEVLSKQMIAEGIFSIQSGDNPRIIEHKLNVFLAPSTRAMSAPGKNPPKPKQSKEAPEPDPRHRRAPEVIAQLRSALSGSEKPGSGRPTVGALMPLMDEEAQLQIFELLGEDPPAPPKRLLAFAFEDIEKLTDREVQVILRETEMRTLTLALQGASDAVLQKIVANVSERVGTMLREEMIAKRSASPRDVIDAQLAMLYVIHLLAEKGQVSATS